jgi:hypothetical protein
MSAPQQLLFGGGMKPVNLDPHTISGADFEVINPSTATATFTLNSSGVAQATTVGSGSNPPAGTTNYTDEWMRVGPNSAYEARATLVSGTLSSGTVGTWQVLSTTRSWTVTSSVGGGGGHAGKDCTILVEIRDASTLVVIDSDNIALSSDANSG